MPRKTPYTSVHPFISFPGLSLLVLLSALLLRGQAVSAETRYVKPSTEVPIKSGHGSEFKTLAVVLDGTQVELLEEIDPWARVRTPAGIEGWILKRYLRSEPPPANTVASLQAEKAQLEGTSGEISRKFNELSQTHAQSAAQLEACRAERDEARHSYETLRQQSADVEGVQKNLAEKSKELQAAQAELTATEQERSTLKRNTNLMWFLAGGLVMLCGWLLGSLSAKARKRKTTLY